MTALLSELPSPVQTLAAAGRLRLQHPRRHLPVASKALPELSVYAMRHGMVAWLPSLIDIAPVPDTKRISEIVQAHAIDALRGTNELLDLLARFRAAGIPVVALKGPALSAFVYGDPGMRRFSDIDLLVPDAVCEDAVRTLQSEGYRCTQSAGAARAIAAGMGAISLRRDGRFPVDLHWRLAARRFPSPIDEAAIFQNAVTIPIAGRDVPVPCAVHTAVMMLTHSAKHVWYALELVFGIASLGRRHQIDWTQVRELLKRGGAVRAGAVGLRLAADLFDCDVPSAFARDVRSRAVDRLRHCAREALSLPPYVFPDRWLDRRAHLLGFDRLGNRVMYDLRRLLEPTSLEAEWVTLPPALAPFYVPARLVRLTARGFGRLLRG